MLTPVTFADQPVQRIFADALANPLPAAFHDAWIALEVGGSCPTCDPIYIAGGGHGGGFAGSFWKTDLEVHNRGAELGIYTVALLKRGYDNPDPMINTYTIEPGTSTRFVDAAFTEFGWGGWATLLVRPVWGDLLAAGRLYNEQQTGPCTGCLFGGLLSPLKESRAFEPGDQARLIQLSHSMDHYAGFRCHLGLVSATAQIIDVRADFYDAAGAHLGTLSYHLGPLKSHLQTDVFEKLDPPVGVEDGYIVLTSSSAGAKFFAYAMQRESQIGDPIMIVAE